MNPNSLFDSLKNARRSRENFIASSEGILAGKTALVVSGGPSRMLYPRLLRELEALRGAENVILVAVKDSYRLVRDRCDIHFINSGNLKKYKYSTPPLVIYTNTSFKDHSFVKRDVTFYVEARSSMCEGVCAKKQFNDYCLSLTGPMRPLGPGIMHESILYTLKHMGVSEVHTIGWDIADEKGQNSVPIKRSSLFKYVLKGLKSIVTLRDNKYNDFVQPKIQFILKLCWYYMNYPLKLLIYQFGGTINRSSMIPGEAELVASSISETKRWLSNVGIKLVIHSNSSWMTNK
jgi:hypothetical protein